MIIRVCYKRQTGAEPGGSRGAREPDGISVSFDCNGGHDCGLDMMLCFYISFLIFFKTCIEDLNEAVVLNYADVETDNLDVRDRVYAANRGDMEATLHMLDQLEPLAGNMRKIYAAVTVAPKGNGPDHLSYNPEFSRLQPQAFYDGQTQNQQLLQQSTDRENYNTKIGVEGERLGDQVASENGSLETHKTRRTRYNSFKLLASICVAKVMQFIFKVANAFEGQAEALHQLANGLIQRALALHRQAQALNQKAKALHLPLCDYEMMCNLISPLWAAKALLHLRVYYLATAIRCWIVVGKIDPYLGGAARRRAYSHDGAHTLISHSALLTFLAPRSAYSLLMLS
nr:hypothetical protein [Tanacetum cinerariifolium]